MFSLILGMLLFNGMNLVSAQAIEQLCRAATERGETFVSAGLSKEVCCPLLPELPECKKAPTMEIKPEKELEKFQVEEEEQWTVF